MGDQRLDRAHGERRGQREGHGGGIPHFQRRDVEHMRQVLAAERFRRCQSIPAAFPPVAVEFRPAVRGLHLAVAETSALFVADLAERRHLIAGEPSRLFQDRLDQIGAQVPEPADLQGVRKAGHVVQGEGDLLDRCLVHGVPPPHGLQPRLC